MHPVPAFFIGLALGFTGTLWGGGMMGLDEALNRASTRTPQGAVSFTVRPESSNAPDGSGTDGRTVIGSAVGRLEIAAPALPGTPGSGTASNQAVASLPSVGVGLMDVEGQTVAQVLERLGPPRLRRREGSAEYWQYQIGDCVFGVVLLSEDGAMPHVILVQPLSTQRRGGESPSALSECARLRSVRAPT